MRGYTLGHLSNAVLLRDLKHVAARDRETTAVLLAHIAEVDARKLYAAEGYSSMFTYCVQELHFSEDAAYKRIQAARAGRRFPQLLEALAEGRVHLTGAGLLAPHLTDDNVDRFIEAATHRCKSEIEAWLAANSVSHATVSARGSSIRPIPELAPAQVGDSEAELPFNQTEVACSERALDPVSDGAPKCDLQLAPAQVEAASAETPSISGPRFLVQFTIDQETHDRLRHVQALLSHAVPINDVGGLFRRALEALAVDVEKKKLGALPRVRTAARKSGLKAHRVAKRNTQGGANGAEPSGAKLRPRYISARIRRAVWERDQGQCTFVSASGHRCGERRFLEFDHADPIARGGTSTVHGLRLRCRAHNQLEAERAFGAQFVRMKRDHARATRTEAKAQVEARASLEKARADERAQVEAEAKAKERLQDIVEGLRTLGCRGLEARRAAKHAVTSGGATLEDQMRAALSFVTRRSRASISRPAEVVPPIQAQPPYGVHTNLAPS